MMDFWMLLELHQKYRIPESVRMKKPRPFSRADTAEEGWLCFYKEFLAARVRFSLDHCADFSAQLTVLYTTHAQLKAYSELYIFV